MTTNLFKANWTDIDVAELRCILHERIGGPGQYYDQPNNPNTFYLPLHGSSCQVKLTFSQTKEIVAIEPGPAFDAAKWARVTEDIETPGPLKVGRDCSFSGFRVLGSWRGRRSGVQMLPPPADAPQAPVEMAEHPFILEFPIKVSDSWQITNYRRIREHRRLTLLLNILLAGHTTCQPRRPRHLWAVAPGEYEAKWVQEFFWARFGEAVVDELSPPAAERLEELDPEGYYTNVGLDGKGLRVPADLDEAICCYKRLSKENAGKFSRASFWMDMASRQWTTSFSASFASLVIAIEALADRRITGAKARFREFIEGYAPGAALKARRNEMYALRSDILHGSALMQMDQDAHFGWDPPEHNEEQLHRELWGLAQIALRNWLKNPSPA